MLDGLPFGLKMNQGLDFISALFSTLYLWAHTFSAVLVAEILTQLLLMITFINCL